MNDDEMLTPAEVAEWLQVSQDTVYRWLREGRLPALHIRRTYRIRRADVLEMIREKE